MKTLIERANEYTKKWAKMLSVTNPSGLKEGYIQGAVQQREIDIQRACEILRKTDYFKNDEGISEAAMEEQFIQAMKGE